MSGLGEDVPPGTPNGPPPEDIVCCWNCRFTFDGLDYAKTPALRCNRYPPKPQILMIEVSVVQLNARKPPPTPRVMTCWPSVSPTDLCGEFEPREGKELLFEDKWVQTLAPGNPNSVQ